MKESFFFDTSFDHSAKELTSNFNRKVGGRFLLGLDKSTNKEGVTPDNQLCWGFLLGGEID